MDQKILTLNEFFGFYLPQIKYTSRYIKMNVISL